MFKKKEEEWMDRVHVYAYAWYSYNENEYSPNL